MMKSLFMIMIISAITLRGYSLLSQHFNVAAIPGNVICSAYCMYRIGSNTLVARCSASSTQTLLNDYCL